MLVLVPAGRGPTSGRALVSGGTAMMMPCTSPTPQPTFSANGCKNLYRKWTDSKNSQLYEFNINEHCSIKQGSLIDSGIFTVTIQLPVIGYRVLLYVDVHQSVPLVPSSKQGYACQWSLGNSKRSGPAHRQRAFFMPAIRLDFRQPASIGRLAGGATRKGARCSSLQFPKPVRLPAPKPGYFPFLGDKPVTNPHACTPRELAFYSHHLEAMRNATYGINAITRIAREMLSSSGENRPEWWSEWTEDGLLSAIQTLGSSINDTLEFLQERAEEHRTRGISDGPR